jgi:hypothetical protein
VYKEIFTHNATTREYIFEYFKNSYYNNAHQTFDGFYQKKMNGVMVPVPVTSLILTVCWIAYPVDGMMLRPLTLNPSLLALNPPEL